MSFKSQQFSFKRNSFHLITLAVLFGCSGKYSDFPLDKRFWTPDDYDHVVYKIRFTTDDDERLPTFDNPETRLILEKLTDEENYKVLLDDETLGLQYRNEVAEKFFLEWKDMNRIYWQMDRQDKYMYPIELVSCYNFGMGLQLRYFRLGNDAIRENSMNPNSGDTQNTIGRNVKTLISNYNNYLSIVKNEEAFSNEAIDKYSKGVKQYFSQLVNEYPKANYKETKSRLLLLKEKTESKNLINSIDSVLELIDSKNEPENKDSE